VLSEEAIHDYRSLRRGDATSLRPIAHRVFASGNYMTGEKNYLSLAHTDADVDQTLAAFAGALAQ
jgi:glutamate-1-semialdehyde aminotransferase